MHWNREFGRAPEFLNSTMDMPSWTLSGLGDATSPSYTYQRWHHSSCHQGWGNHPSSYCWPQAVARMERGRGSLLTLIKLSLPPLILPQATAQRSERGGHPTSWQSCPPHDTLAISVLSQGGLLDVNIVWCHFLLPFIQSVIHNPFNYLSTTILCWTQWSKAVNQVLLVWEILRGWERQGSLLDSVSTSSVKSKVLDLMATPTLLSQSLQTPSCPGRRVLRHSTEYSTSEFPTGSAVYFFFFCWNTRVLSSHSLAAAAVCELMCEHVCRGQSSTGVSTF